MLRRRKYVIVLSTLALLLTSICASLINSAKATAPSDFFTPGSAPWGTTIDGSGRVWVALPGCDPSPTCSNSTPPGKIGVFNPTSNSWTATYTLPSGFGQALFTAFDQQGRLWFPLPMSNSIGMLNPTNNTFQRWTVPTGSAGPWDIAVDSHGRVLFTEHYVNKIGVFDPSTQHFTEIATPASNSQPYGIVVDGSNNVWFTENNSAVALIAEYTAQGSLREYKIRNGSTSGLTPHMITIDHNGNIWWSEGWVAMIGELKVSQAQPGTNQGVTEYGYPHPCANCGTHTSGIAVDYSGNVWFDDSLQSTYGSFPVSGSGSFSMHATPTSNSHPHDGMNVDGQNRVYFDEETVNKLAVIPTSSGITPTPTSTPSPTPTKTGTPTATPTPSTTPTPGATLAQDTFQRANQSLWGKASDGLTWGGDANTATSFSISGNTGHVSGNSSSYSAVLGAAATNAEVLFSGSLSSFSNSNIGAVLRWTDGNNWYKAYIDGSNLVIQRKVAGSTTVLATTPFAASASTSYSLRFRVVGTALSAKVWASAGAEPAAWTATASDTSFTSGSCGLRTLVQSGNTATFTAFSATTR